MKKGLTLVELLGVIILIGAILLVSIPVVTNEIRKARETLYIDQINNIELAAMNWYNDYSFRVPVGEKFVITLAQLQQTGKLDRELRNPLTRNLLPNDMEIEIRNNDGIVRAFVANNCATPNRDCSTSDSNINFAEPFIQINGAYVVYVEVCCSTCASICTSVYTDQGANATASGTVNVDRLGVYQIRYTATQNARTVIHIRNVVVRDTTAPVINFPATTNVSRNNIANYCPTNDVTVLDNSGEMVAVICEGRLINQLGPQSLRYIATDSSGNTATRYRTFNVTN